jgi:iron(III) transport system ATP-binding protein
LLLQGGNVASVELKGLTKHYGNAAAVDGVSLSVEHGQLVCLLGPSGCGKTTTLRLIAGFIEPSAGEIQVGGKLLSSPARTVPPEGRNMSMIFQSYALWPHMTVAENVAYGLKIRKLDKATVSARLKAILSTTRLEALADRYPGELSGGQQQRVSLARALGRHASADAGRHRRAITALGGDRHLVLRLRRRDPRAVGCRDPVHV